MMHLATAQKAAKPYQAVSTKTRQHGDQRNPGLPADVHFLAPQVKSPRRQQNWQQTQITTGEPDVVRLSADCSKPASAFFWVPRQIRPNQLSQSPGRKAVAVTIQIVLGRRGRIAN